MKILKILMSCFFILIIIFILQKQDENYLIEEDPTKTINSLVSKKRGIFVFGFDECPWCRELYPILEEELKSEKVYASFVNTHSETMTKIDKENLKQFIQKNTPFDDIIVPVIFFVGSNESIDTHVGTVENHDAPNHKLSDSQKDELKVTLQQKIRDYKLSYNLKFNL